MPREQSARLSQAEVEAEIQSVSGADWKRAESLARFAAHGIAHMTGETMLSEALMRLQDGARRWRKGVPFLVTLKLVLRSIASNERKRAAGGAIDEYVGVAEDFADEESGPSVAAVTTATPEDIAAAREQLAAIDELFADDEDAYLVLLEYAQEGHMGKDLAKKLGMDAKTFDAARKRVLWKLKKARG